MKEKNIQVLWPTAMAIFGLFTGYHVQENVGKNISTNNKQKCILKI